MPWVEIVLSNVVNNAKKKKTTPFTNLSLIGKFLLVAVRHDTWAESARDLLEAAEAQQGVVGHRLYLVPFQVDVSQILHASDGSRDPAEVVLEAEQLFQRCLLYEDTVWDVEEVAVWQVQAHQLLQPGEGPCMKVADVFIVRHFQDHQVGEALQDRGSVVGWICRFEDVVFQDKTTAIFSQNYLQENCFTWLLISNMTSYITMYVM